MKRSLTAVAIAVLLLFSAASLFGEAPVQKSVLLIYDARTEMRGNTVVDAAIRKVLTDEFGFNVDIRSEFFEDANFPAEDFPIFMNWLRRKYSGKTFDVVVPVGGTALQFVGEYGKQLFPGTPTVYWGRRGALETWGSSLPITGVVAPSMENQVDGTFAFIRKLQPDLNRLVVVSGTSSVDLSWEAAARRVLQPFDGAISVSYLAGLSLEEIEKKISGLPSKSAILLLTINEDGTGRRLLRNQYLDKLVQEASAPAYSTSNIYLDTGIVGGDLLNQEATSKETAGLIVKILRGEDIRNLPIRQSSLEPTVNWKALKRWGLPEDRIPPDTAIMFREVSMWDQYRWEIIGIVSLCIFEACLIVALLVHRANRRRAERATVESKQMLQSTIDALNTRVALLDQDGKTIVVNRRWEYFAEANRQSNGQGAIAFRRQDDEARLISDAVQRIKSGELEDFRCVYPSPQPDGMTWFQVRVNQFDMQGALRLVVTHEDVTEIKQAHDAQQQLTGLLMRAQDEERRRIARDLHDVTVQNVVAIKADLDGVKTDAKELDAGAAEMLRESMSLCDQVIQELRTLSYLLHPPFLDEAGLVPALRWFVRGFIQRSGINVELLAREDVGRLPMEVETALFRVVQESLANIHRHSGSKRASIWITRNSDTVVLRILDEGRGFEIPSTPGDPEGTLLPGGGIQGMRQRLKQLGGKLEIESSPEGTRINARVSISEERRAANSGSR